MGCLINPQIIMDEIITSDVIKFIMTVLKHRQLHPDDKLTRFVRVAQIIQIFLRK